MAKIYQVLKPRSRDEWLMLRGIGGSSAGLICGVKGFGDRTLFDLYLECIGRGKKNVSNEAIEKGNALEPLIRDQVRVYVGKQYKVQSPPKNNWVYVRRDKKYMTASLDGVLTDIKTGEKGVLEIKTHEIRSRADAEEWENGTLPQQYYVQVLHYLNVTGWNYAVLVANLEYYKYEETTGRRLDHVDQRYYYFKSEEIKADLKYEEDKVTEFWESNVEKRIPPEIKVN